MKKRILKSLAALVLVLCMVAPMMATAANTTCYIRVTITDDKAGKTLVADSSHYLTDAAPLAGEVVTLINKNYDALEVFRSPGMKRILDKGVQCYRSFNDQVWADYLEDYFVDVNSDLKTLLKDKAVNVGVLTPRNHYSIAFTNDIKGDRTYGTTYTVTVTRYLDGQFDSDPDTIGLGKFLSVDYHNAFMNGSDGLFRPAKEMTRAEAAQVFYNLLKDQNVETTVSFPDVPKDAWFAPAVNAIGSIGIIEGDADGKFRPNDPIKRVEFVALAARFVTAVEGKLDFTDIAGVAWAHDELATAVGYGWINGYGDGTFRPNAPITRAEVVSMITKMMERTPDTAYIAANLSKLASFTDVPEGHWAYSRIMEAANSHAHTYTTSGVEVWTEVQ